MFEYPSIRNRRGRALDRGLELVSAMAGTFYALGVHPRAWHESGSHRRTNGRERRAEMTFLTWIVLGLIAGAIAKLLMPGRDPQGCIITIVIGVVGALLGGWLATKLKWGGAVSGLNIPSLVTAVLGAIL